MDRGTIESGGDLHALDDFDWEVRAAIYAFVVATGRPPSVAELASRLGRPEERVALAFVRLHARHAIFLEPGALAIRMAHPFSGVPTRFRVSAAGRTYWANCAWDMLGIPAALYADGVIHAQFADAPDDPVTLHVRGDHIDEHGEVVHFSRPFRTWYDDLIRT
jgi:hypothetical protein